MNLQDSENAVKQNINSIDKFLCKQAQQPHAYFHIHTYVHQI